MLGRKICQERVELKHDSGIIRNRLVDWRWAESHTELTRDKLKGDGEMEIVSSDNFGYLKIIAPIVTLLIFFAQDATKYIWPRKSSVPHKWLRILLIIFAVLSSSVTIFTVIIDSQSNNKLADYIIKIKENFSTRENNLNKQIAKLNKDLNEKMNDAKTLQENLSTNIGYSNKKITEANIKISSLNDEVKSLSDSNEKLKENLREANNKLKQLGVDQDIMREENAGYNINQNASLGEALKNSKECNEKISELGRINLQVNTDLAALKSFISSRDYPAAQEKIIEIEKKNNRVVQILNAKFSQSGVPRIKGTPEIKQIQVN